MKPLVSVVIPTYNSRSTIDRTLKSVREQTFRDYEIIVVDDGSKDGTREFLQAQKDIRTEFQNNQGAGPARNTGVRKSSGKYIAFLDADDEWHPRKLELQLEVAKKVQKFGIISNEIKEVIEGRDDQREKWVGQRPLLPRKLRVFNFYHMLKRCYTQTSTVLIPKLVLEETGGFDGQWWTGQDRDLWIKIAYNYCVYQIPTPLVRYYVLPDSLFKRNKIVNFANQLLIMEQWWPGKKGSLDHQDKLDEEAFLKIFRSSLYHIEKLILKYKEEELADAVWERYGEVFGLRKELVYKRIRFISAIRTRMKKRRSSNKQKIAGVLEKLRKKDGPFD